jgi:hypothetical protein
MRRERLGIARPERELDEMKACRNAMMRIIDAYPIHGPEYLSAGRVVRHLDELAGQLIGDEWALLDDVERVMEG